MVGDLPYKGFQNGLISHIALLFSVRVVGNETVEVVDTGLARELVIVITVCSIVVVMGVGVVVIYLLSIRHRAL